jgi:hypothetical protein
MQTCIGVDYYRKYSYVTAMGEKGEIFDQDQVANHPEAIRECLPRVPSSTEFFPKGGHIEYVASGCLHFYLVDPNNWAAPLKENRKPRT